MTQQPPQSKHFHLHELTDGVWAAVHRPGGWAISNAGIVDLGEETLVFDTFMTPAAADDLRDAAETLTGRRVARVVLSHYHNDHIWGAQVFEGAAFLATHETRRLIHTKGQEEHDFFAEQAPAQLERLENRMAAGPGEAEQQEIAFLFPYYNAMVESFPILQIQDPGQTFADRMVFHGSRRPAELLTYGGGHTGSDALLYLPDDGVIFLSDLLFAESIPYLADGDPWENRQILDKVAKLGAHTLVPGHGPVGSPKHLDLMKSYIQAVEASTREAVSVGRSEKDVLGQPIPEAFAGWEFPPFHKANVRYFFQHYSGLRASPTG